MASPCLHLISFYSHFLHILQERFPVLCWLMKSRSLWRRVTCMYSVLLGGVRVERANEHVFNYQIFLSFSSRADSNPSNTVRVLRISLISLTFSGCVSRLRKFIDSHLEKFHSHVVTVTPHLENWQLKCVVSASSSSSCQIVFDSLAHSRGIDLWRAIKRGKSASRQIWNASLFCLILCHPLNFDVKNLSSLSKSSHETWMFLKNLFPMDIGGLFFEVRNEGFSVSPSQSAPFPHPSSHHDDLLIFPPSCLLLYATLVVVVCI